MELKLNRETINADEIVSDSIQEQAAELDLILPDYYPDIFRLIKCTLTPRITSHTVLADKITYELVIGVKILYCGEQSARINCTEQRITCSKTVELGKIVDNPGVSFCPKVDYVNCRVVNKRRLDIRGAVSVKVRVTAETKQEVVSDAFGTGIQLRRKNVSYAASRLSTALSAVFSEEFDLGYSKPPIGTVIAADAQISGIDKKVIANKLIAKGEAKISVLYTCERDGADCLENMQFTLPFSRIIDIDGIDEQCETVIKAAAVSCEVTPKPNEEGELKLLECELMIEFACTAVRSMSAGIVTDAYSTACKCTPKFSAVKLEGIPECFSENMMLAAQTSYQSGEISCIYDARGSVSNVSVRYDSDRAKPVVMGTLNFCVMAKTADNIPVMLETSKNFEYVPELENTDENTVFEPDVSVVSCSYNLSSESVVDLKAEIHIAACVKRNEISDCITDIETAPDDPDEKHDDCAVKLYFAEENEEIWDIAKRYRTSVSAITEENELDGGETGRRMLLIPMTN